MVGCVRCTRALRVVTCLWLSLLAAALDGQGPAREVAVAAMDAMPRAPPGV